MKRTLLVLLLSSSLTAFAQGRPGSHPGGGPPSGIPGAGSGAGSSHGSPDQSSMGQSHGMSETQQPLKSAQINGGAFRMLEKKTGMTADQLQALYGSSGAKNFGQFASALVVSENLGPDSGKVLDGLKTGSLGHTLQSLGIDKKKAKDEMRKADQEVKDASRQS